MGAAEALGGACQDGFCRANWVLVHVAVPYAKYGPAFAPQPFVTYHVAFRLRVLPAVDLNDELCLAAGEICDVRADRKLSREPGPIARQQMPDFAFLGVAVERSARARRVSVGFMRWDIIWTRCVARFAHPPLAPPFQGGGLTHQSHHPRPRSPGSE